MLLSLLKILLFLAAILAIALGLNALSVNWDGVRIVLNGTEYTLGPIQTVVALAVALAVIWVAFKLLGLLFAFLRFVMGDETAINRYFARSRREKGLEALSQGMVSVASGEGKQAQAYAAQAEKYLDDARAVRLLKAQAAEIAGDDRQAENVYREMLGDDRTRFAGVRGLMHRKLAEGDNVTALQLAQKAYALKPRHTEVQDTVLRLAADQGDWKGARSVLKDKRKQGEIPQDVHIRRDAVLALQEAQEVLRHENSISAREAAISAAKASPDLVPAVVLAARSYLARKEPRNAEKLLEKAWSVRPHPEIAAAYAEIRPEETPNQRLARFESLLRKNADHEESRLLRTELQLANEDFPAARRALGDLAQTHPTTRSLALMAAIERGEGSDDAAVRGWLVKAMNASRGPQWVCDRCETIAAEWAPICENCKGFDTLSWREPVEKAHAAGTATGAELLPLLIGRPERADLHGDTAADTVEGSGEMADSAAEPRAATPKTYSTQADVAPGMVPRESDFVSPEATAGQGTDNAAPDPAAPVARDVPAAPEEAAVEITPAPEEPKLVRPDVEPPPDPKRR